MGWKSLKALILRASLCGANKNIYNKCYAQYPSSNLSLDGAADIVFTIGVTSTDVVSMVSMLKKKKSS